ncbi:molybdenum cofactor biosynthesis protein MoaE [Kribbella solani]|uniref:Molybdopterin synthase catalytic subunit 1 n=1 Tax=Kribbella solani TaxID=236067 RepID=A0A841E0E2_9ACTN|nr:molybdenum cofactor biosynthesis protein MoaE [Kribbella solani]MBB5983691.1 molybdopterin synthase catalytic subunit [Kribbella solani]MDX2973392.1 molybdenum cofactor biosynthesis protein MoaE [Kribbella solani]MDX3002954.1 molybdenum cofactor biosynthesis protein MoaE [Kribbella solani]
MSDAIRLLDIRDGVLSSDEVLAAVSDPAAGGTALFIGTVRDHDQDKPVDRLGYEAHPDALEHLRKVAQRICDDPAVTALAAVHRTGDLEIGDAAVIVAVAAAHRDVAFAACRQLIDELKAEVPIWKHQHFTDGGSEWVGAH